MQLENELRRPAYNESVDVGCKFTKWRFKSVASDSMDSVETRKPRTSCEASCAAVRNTSVECPPPTCLPQLGFNRVAPSQKSILFYVANPWRTVMLLSCSRCVSHEAPSYHVILTKLLLSLSVFISQHRCLHWRGPASYGEAVSHLISIRWPTLGRFPWFTIFTYRVTVHYYEMWKDVY